mgnify:CR=1 FL=1
MDTEQLKMILEVINQASDGAKQFGILWLIKEFLTPIAMGIITVTGLTLFIKGVAKAVNTHESNQSKSGLFLNDVASLYNYDVTTSWGEFDRDKVEILFDCVRRERESEKNSK